MMPPLRLARVAERLDSDNWSRHYQQSAADGGRGGASEDVEDQHVTLAICT